MIDVNTALQNMRAEENIARVLLYRAADAGFGHLCDDILGPAREMPKFFRTAFNPHNSLEMRNPEDAAYAQEVAKELGASAGSWETEWQKATTMDSMRYLLAGFDGGKLGDMFCQEMQEDTPALRYALYKTLALLDTDGTGQVALAVYADGNPPTQAIPVTPELRLSSYNFVHNLLAIPESGAPIVGYTMGRQWPRDWAVLGDKNQVLLFRGDYTSAPYIFGISVSNEKVKEKQKREAWDSAQLLIVAADASAQSSGYTNQELGFVGYGVMFRGVMSLHWGPYLTEVLGSYEENQAKIALGTKLYREAE